MISSRHSSHGPTTQVVGFCPNGAFNAHHMLNSNMLCRLTYVFNWNYFLQIRSKNLVGATLVREMVCVATRTRIIP